MRKVRRNLHIHIFIFLLIIFTFLTKLKLFRTFKSQFLRLRVFTALWSTLQIILSILTQIERNTVFIVTFKRIWSPYLSQISWFFYVFFYIFLIETTIIRIIVTWWIRKIVILAELVFVFNLLLFCCSHQESWWNYQCFYGLSIIS